MHPIKGLYHKRIIAILLSVCIACGISILYFIFSRPQPIPKPKGEMRIERLDTAYYDIRNFPLTFPISHDAIVDNDTTTHSDGNHWLTIRYPRHNTLIYCTYTPISRSTLSKQLQNRLDRIIKNNTLKMPKSIVFETDTLSKEGTRPSAELFFSDNRNAVIPLQFIATDSISYLLSGAVYFQGEIKVDSISPVIDILTEDILYGLQHIHR